MKFLSNKLFKSWLYLLATIFLSSTVPTLSIITKIQIFERFNEKLGKIQRVVLLGDTHWPLQGTVEAQILGVKILLASLDSHSSFIVEDITCQETNRALTALNFPFRLPSLKETSYFMNELDNAQVLNGLCFWAAALNTQARVINVEYRFILSLFMSDIKQAVLKGNYEPFKNFKIALLGKEQIDFFALLKTELDYYKNMLVNSEEDELKKKIGQTFYAAYEQIFEQLSKSSFFERLATSNSSLENFLEKNSQEKFSEFIKAISDNAARYLDIYAASVLEKELFLFGKENCYVFMGENHLKNIALLLTKIGFHSICGFGVQDIVLEKYKSASEEKRKAILRAKTKEDLKALLQVEQLSFIPGQAIADLAHLDQFIAKYSISNSNNNNINKN